MSLYRNVPLDGAREGPLPDAARLKVGFVLREKFTLNAFSSFIDALRLAADRGGRSRQLRCAWKVMGDGPVRASCGLLATPDEPLGEPGRFDYVAVCGGNGYLDNREDANLAAFLRDAVDAGIPLIGVCTGTFDIARAGLMHGYRACVHWNVYDAFRDQFPGIDAVPDQIFLDGGARITCAGSAGAADLALHLISRHCGSEPAQQVIRHMMLQEMRPATYPQAHFHSDLSGIGDDCVRRAAHLMEQSLNEPITTRQIARHVDVSLRQLERRFREQLDTTPGSYYRSLRLRYGAWLLRHTELSIGTIANDCGFSDGAHFSRHFRNTYGLPPSQLRAGLRGKERAAGDGPGDPRPPARIAKAPPAPEIGAEDGESGYRPGMPARS